MSSEAELIDAAKSGSAIAFTELVHAYRERLLRFLLTRCSSHADAEDALQDTFVNAYRYLDSYDPRWRFSTWLYRIALRNAAKLPDAAIEGEDEIHDESADPLRQCIAHNDRENLWLTARRVLPHEVYTAMWLRYVEDMSIRDISEVLERTGSWTKVNLMRARKSLEASFQDDASTNGRKVYG